MKKIAYICHQFPILTQTFVFNEVFNLKRRGFDIRVHAMKRPSKPDIKALPGASEIPMETLPRLAGPGIILLSLFSFFTSPVKAARVLSMILKRSNTHAKRSYSVLPVFAMRGLVLAERLRAEGGYDFIYTHGLGEEAIAAYTASYITGIPLAMRVHMPMDLIAGNEFYCEMAKSCKALICESEYVRDMLVDMCSNCIVDNVHVVHCGVNTQVEARPLPNTVPETVTVVSVGGMDGYKKGHRYLIEAFRILSQENIPARLKIVGDGTIRSQLEKQASDLGVSGNLDFLGALPHEDMLEVVAGADIFCMACIIDDAGDRDGIPVALMEAMSLGKPCVSSNLHPIPELIEDGVEGILAEPKDPKSIAEALKKLIHAPELRAEMGQRAREKVIKEFAQKGSAEKLAAILNKL